MPFGEDKRGVCTKCGKAHGEQNHVCDMDDVRLLEIDREAGPRVVREALIALGQKGFQNKVETLEAEASVIRARKAK